MSEDDVLFGYRLRVLEYAARSSVSEACRVFGIHQVPVGHPTGLPAPVAGSGLTSVGSARGSFRSFSACRHSAQTGAKTAHPMEMVTTIRM
jgi:hypothetical protein